MLSTLAKVSERDRTAQSADILEALLRNAAYQRAKNVALFISMPMEVQTRPIIASAVATKSVFVPKVTGKEMSMYKLHSAEEIDSFEKTAWGIPEPDSARDSFTDVATETDLVIVPCVAITRDGRRLGHGGGYYDKFLNSLNAKRKSIGQANIHTIGIALKCQIVEDVPTDEHDVRIDELIG